jgi:Arc/MetJ family transcription regulator
MVRIDDDLIDEVMGELVKELTKMERSPYRRALQRILGFRPTAEALQNFANKSPDKWAQAVTMLAGLAGYEKGVNVTLTVRPVHQMTDAELLEENRKLTEELRAVGRGLGEGVGEVVLLPGKVSDGS